jgi:hypothetical protein
MWTAGQEIVGRSAPQDGSIVTAPELLKVAHCRHWECPLQDGLIGRPVNQPTRPTADAGEDRFRAPAPALTVNHRI